MAAKSTPAMVGNGPQPRDSRPEHRHALYQPVNDYHYSWMFTGALTNASNQACFDGNIVIFENRPFGDLDR